MSGMYPSGRAGLAMMMAAIASQSLAERRPRVYVESTNRPWRPWDHVNLTKAERRGKTYEEIQAMRRERWEAAGGQT